MGTYNQVGNGFTQPAVPMPRYASPYLGSPGPKPAGYPAFSMDTTANNFIQGGDTPLMMKGLQSQDLGVYQGVGSNFGLDNPVMSNSNFAPNFGDQAGFLGSFANDAGLGAGYNTPNVTTQGFTNPFATGEGGLNSLGMTNFQTASAGIGALTAGVNAYSALQGVGLAKKQFAQSTDQWNKNWAGQKTAFNDKIASDAEAAYARNGGTSLTPDEAVAKRGIH